MADPILGIFFGLLTMLVMGVGAAIIQNPTKKLGVVQTVFLRNGALVTGLFLLLALGIFPQTFDPSVLIPIIGLGILGYLALISFYKGLSVGKVGVVVPIASSNIFITVLLSILFFSEHLSLIQGIAIIAIIIGGILLSVRTEDWKKSKSLQLNAGVLFALITCVGWGIWAFYMKVPVLIVGPILTSLLIEGFIFLSAGFHFLVSKKKWIPFEWKLGKWIILAGFLGAIGSLSYNLGIEVANVSLVAALAACAPLASTLYARFVFNEQLTLQQWIAIGLKLAGIVLLSVSI